MNLANMRMNPWTPFAGLRDLQREMNRLFELGPREERVSRYPLVNVLSNQDEALVTAEIPGVDPADLEISLLKGELTIRGTVKDSAPAGDEVICHRKERGSGSFSRTILLPFEVEEGKISAKCDKGVLMVTLPRAEKTKPRTIPITTD